jgi:hypothetical protein
MLAELSTKREQVEEAILVLERLLAVVASVVAGHRSGQGPEVQNPALLPPLSEVRQTLPGAVCGFSNANTPKFANEFLRGSDGSGTGPASSSSCDPGSDIGRLRPSAWQ